MFSYLTLSSMLLALLLWSVPSALPSSDSQPSGMDSGWNTAVVTSNRFGSVDGRAVGAGGSQAERTWTVSTASQGPSASAPTIHISRSEPTTRTRDANDVQLAIVEASREFGQDPALMLRVAWCESKFDPHAVGRAEEIGIFQIKPTTWVPNARRLGYTIADITDPVAQSRVASEMFSRGQSGQWTCQ